MRRVSFAVFTLVMLALQLGGASVLAQYVNPNVTWSTSTKKISDSEFDLILKGTIAPGFHLYSQNIADGGPVPTSFTFEKSGGYKLIGKVKEGGNRFEAVEPVFDNMMLTWYEETVTFTQRVKILKPEVTVKGFVNFMTCNDKLCDPPSDYLFKYALSGVPVSEAAPVDTAAKVAVPMTDTGAAAIKEPARADTVAAAAAVPADAANQPANELVDGDVRSKSYWSTFLAGVVNGLIALLFPCVWPVIPLTVSFFLKQNEGGKKNRRGSILALFYSLSIMIIFVLIGVMISALTNGQMANSLSTGWFFNILFFVIFFLLGLSFLGVFEITLPSGFVNKVDSMSLKGGLIGIFFMAFALVLISFSCTVLFISNLISIVTVDGDFVKPIVGFAGFGLAFGLPFGLLAWFPTLLKQMPRSGHWMHVLKVSFGLLEIALSFIYLSKVDMAYHWGLLSRDVFLAIWIVIFLVLGLYLLGKVKLTSQDDDSHISVPRLLTAVACLAFSIYMIPGLFGAPLKPLSGFLPNYSEFTLAYEEGGAAGEPDAGTMPSDQKGTGAKKKYATLFESPLGLDLYFDYDDAINRAKELNKPLFIDFTGWGCVNCRKMEKSVWPDPGVLQRLKNDYVAASLYVDDRTPLPENERYYSEKLKKEVKTLGDKNFDLQFSRFSMSAQPYYVLLDTAGNLLAEPRGFTPDPVEYARFLDAGLTAFSTETTAGRPAAGANSLLSRR
jgi:thiol:disulfide interchange protein DsbD